MTGWLPPLPLLGEGGWDRRFKPLPKENTKDAKERSAKIVVFSNCSMFFNKASSAQAPANRSKVTVIFMLKKAIEQSSIKIMAIIIIVLKKWGLVHASLLRDCIVVWRSDHYRAVNRGDLRFAVLFAQSGARYKRGFLCWSVGWLVG